MRCDGVLNTPLSLIHINNWMMCFLLYLELFMMIFSKEDFLLSNDNKKAHWITVIFGQLMSNKERNMS